MLLCFILSKRHVDYHLRQTIANHKDKLQRLIDESPWGNAALLDCVSNLSSHALTDYQHQLLGLGYSFALPPRSDTCTDFLVNLNNLQSYATDIRPELQTLRGLGLSYLQHLESNVTGLPRRFIIALKELKRNDDIICLKAD